MTYEVYILLDVVDGRAEQTTEVLRESRSVVMTDTLEGSPDVIIATEAAERQHLAKRTIQAPASVETMTEHIHLLPVRDKLNNGAFPKISSQNRRSGKRGGSKTCC